VLLNNIVFWLGIAILMYLILAAIFERPEDKKYVGYAIVEELLMTPEERQISRKGTLERGVYPVLNLLRNMLKLSEGTRTTIQEELIRAGSKDTPEEVVAMQWLFGGVMLVITLTAAWFMHNTVVFLIGTFLTVYMYNGPRSSLRQRAKRRQFAQESELPDFLDQLIIFLSTGMPFYNALERASEICGPALQADVKLLLNDIKSTGETIEPLKKFAERLNQEGVQNFVTAVEQSMSSDARHAQEIYEKQAEQMRAMRQENIRRIIKAKPGELSMLNMLTYALVASIPVFAMLMKFMQTFNK